jgi:hypothetical protein|tara:strand:- start:39 stop:317 length:279 start_codon:yes stop_codon:yes gene_type:complete
MSDLIIDIPGFQEGDDLPNGYITVYEEDPPLKFAEDGFVWNPGHMEDIEVDGRAAKIIRFVKNVRLTDEQLAELVPPEEIIEGPPAPEIEEA